MPRWTKLGPGFALDPRTGVPGVVSVSQAELDQADRWARRYVMVSAPGLDKRQAVCLRLRSAAVTTPTLHPSDFNAMAIGSTGASENTLELRRLKLGERVGLLPPSVWTLLGASVLAALFALAAAVLPVDQTTKTARAVTHHVHAVAPALATLEAQPQAVAALEQSANEVQHALTHASHGGEDQHLAETIEDKVSETRAQREAARQAATDLVAWSASLELEAGKSESWLRPSLAAAAKVAAGIAGLLAAMLAFGSALPGAIRR
jgi:hypothetical protein